MDTLLEIKNISASVGTKEIIKGLNLKVNKGEVHVILGPNGAGKSTLANIILNNEEYVKTGGEILFCGKDITNLSTDKIAKLGVFMSFQNPIEIPGITCGSFLKYMKSKINDESVNLMKTIKEIEGFATELDMNKKLISRDLNVGFSGGEKKKNEILQMLVFKPKLAILDETDSGLDYDAIKAVSKGISMYHNDENSLIIITHNTNILNSLDVDYVHVLVDGKIVSTGDNSLIDEISKNGFKSYTGLVSND